MAEAQKELQKIRSKDDLYPFMSAKTDERINKEIIHLSLQTAVWKNTAPRYLEAP